MKDHYHVLGVKKDATQAEIKTAYRRRARAVHPDCSDEDGQSFRELQEAYDVLGDPGRRQAYDRKRQRSRQQPHRAWGESLRPSASPFAASDPSSLLSELRRHFGHHSAAPSQRPPRSARVVSARVRITPQEARYGGRLRFRLSLPQVCDRCGGTGFDFYPCAVCRGTGIVRDEMPVEISFPPGMREGQQADLSLASLGLDHLKLSLTFSISP